MAQEREWVLDWEKDEGHANEQYAWIVAELRKLGTSTILESPLALSLVEVGCMHGLLLTQFNSSVFEISAMNTPLTRRPLEVA